MKFIIGKKIDMTQVWQGENVTPVTRVQAGPCPVVQLKTAAKDGYGAVQLGYGLRKEKNIKKPQTGHLKKAGITSKDGKTNLKYLREFRDEIKDLKVGEVIDVNTFAVGDTVKAVGTSKGKGFQGNVRRHGFHGHNTTHGTKDQVRTSGSIGAGGVQHVLKGMRMPGRMGNSKATASNLKIVKIDKENNILYISGAIPGARNGLVLISGEGELKATEPKAEEVKVEKAEETKPIEAVETNEEKTETQNSNVKSQNQNANVKSEV